MNRVSRAVSAAGMGAAMALVMDVTGVQAQAPAPRQPARPAASAPPPPAPSPIFPCRTAAEICYLGVVSGAKLIVVLTNAKNADSLGETPVDVTGPDGAKLDLAPHAGRVVMLTGEYDGKTSLAKAELVEVASPLVSLALKAQFGAGGEEEEPSPPPPAAAPRGQGGGAAPRR